LVSAPGNPINNVLKLRFSWKRMTTCRIDPVGFELGIACGVPGVVMVELHAVSAATNANAKIARMICTNNLRTNGKQAIYEALWEAMAGAFSTTLMKAQSGALLESRAKKVT
jgi:hypothetical protein